tara:strand:- start:64 stop:1461 length:1398 start_codon:yes stop_codon:yes gene_type:complete
MLGISPGGSSYWINSLGANGTLDRWYDCVVDSGDNILVAGNTTSGTTGYGALAAKFDTDGAIQWQRSLDGSNNQQFFACCLGGTTTGGSSEKLYEFGSAGYGGNGGLAANYNNAAGTKDNDLRLVDSLTTSWGSGGATSFAPASSGVNPNIYTRIILVGHVAYGSGAYRGFIHMINPSYQTVATTAFQHPSSSGTSVEFKDAKVDTSNVSDANGTGAKVIVCGHRGGGVSSGNTNLWLGSFTTGGGTGMQSLTLNWQKEIVYTPSTNTAAYMDVDGSGNIYVAGFTYNTGTNPAIYKLNSSGVMQWQKINTSSSWSYAYAIAVDSSGNVYSAGQYSNNAWLVKMDSSGSTVWQREIDGVSGGQEIVIKGMKIDSNGDLIISGWTVVTDTGGQKNTFLMKYPSDGSITGTFGGVWEISNLSGSFSNANTSVATSNLSQSSPTISNTNFNALTDAATSYSPSLISLS